MSVSDPVKEQQDRSFEGHITSVNDLFAGLSTFPGGGCEPYSSLWLDECLYDKHGAHAKIIFSQPPSHHPSHYECSLNLQHGIKIMAEPTGAKAMSTGFPA